MVSDAKQTEQFFASSWGQYEGVNEAEKRIVIMGEAPHSIWADVTWSTAANRASASAISWTMDRKVPSGGAHAISSIDSNLTKHAPAPACIRAAGAAAVRAGGRVNAEKHRGRAKLWAAPEARLTQRRCPLSRPDTSRTVPAATLAVRRLAPRSDRLCRHWNVNRRRRRPAPSSDANREKGNLHCRRDCRPRSDAHGEPPVASLSR